ncbi:MAG: DUF423 domain-containing protein [Bacteroidota bacterium]|nr:DUF423 domain-containing protein [Bacteroidota bacterium]MDP4217926.1 DUF423 domain-containing protein [Bacteroidota bacterium]MDP4245804.1 DUF423 domain-containing protein [Bacteroidota bacterium]MDP4256977.1 DUF423 domain-containing protein [Bacteroidota bacterium]
MNKSFLSIAALFGALSVALGAFAAHKLREMVGPEDVATFETGVRYQFYHVFALLTVALLSEKFANRWMLRAGNCFIAGIILFSGSLYVLTAMKAAESGSLKLAGYATPIGGLFFIAGWFFLWLGVTRKP